MPHVLATEAFNAHPNYAHKLIHKFPCPMVDKGDLHGIWYESLHYVAEKFPEKARIRQLYLVMAYRRMLDTMRTRNRLKNTGPMDWDCNDETKRKYFLEFIRNEDDIRDDNNEDPQEDRDHLTYAKARRVTPENNW